MDHTSRKSCPEKSVEHNEILRQITEQLAKIHSRGEIHGTHLSFLAEIPDSAGKCDRAISNESLNEWRPAEETKTDSKPTKEGDIFSLGCYFYYVITGGQHPFGRPGQRALFIEKNLYHLAGCRDQQLRTLIARMISYDCTKRPNSSELLNHPFLWHSKKIEDYLTNVAENIDENSDQFNKWKGTILLSDKSIGVNRGQKKTAVKVTNVAAVLKEIKEKKANPTDLCQMFPNLLHSVYVSENTGSNEMIEQEIDESRPEIFNDLLIANGNFGEVESVTKIKRRHGRLGLQHVHVIQFQKHRDDTITTKSERLRYLSHPNCLQCFYLVENSSEIYCMAFEPFNETLETWLKKRERKQLDCETITDILRQITKGLEHYHNNKITHGNLSLSQIVIFEKESNVVAKIATLASSPDMTAANMKNDIQKLGQIFSYLLSESRQEMSHLIQTMKESILPSAASVLKHPSLWTPEMTIAFLLAAGDYYVHHPNFDKISKLDIASSAPLNTAQQNLTTNREALQAFSLQMGNLTAEEHNLFIADWKKRFPKLVLQTWLRLQKFKEVSSDEDLDLSSFYHPNYDFPAYDESIDDETIIDIKNDDRTPPQNSDSEFGKSEMHSLKNCIKRILTTKMDQETSSSIMKHIDNLSTRTSRPLPVSLVAHQSDDSYESSVTAFIKELKEVILKFAQLWDKNATLAIDDKYHITPISSAARFAANNKSPQTISLYRKNKAEIKNWDLDKWSLTLHFAVKNNWLQRAKFLLENGADVNAKDVSGNSLLHIAVSINSVEMVQVLLNADADPNPTNCNGETALHLAAAHALSPNRLLIVDLLIKNEANPNVIDNCGRTALFNALFNEAKDVAKRLLQMDCIEIVNQQEFETGLTPLHLAAWHNYEIITTMLLAKDAKVDIKERNGLTPLEYAAAVNAVHVAERLLEADALAISRYQTKNIRSPLHVAAAYDAFEVGVLFISKGADINSIDGLCLTPLHYAAYRKSTRFMEFLKATQENWLDVSASGVSDERHLRKPKLKRNKEKINRKRLYLLRRHKPQTRRKRQSPNQQQNHTIPYLSKNLSPDELASIPELIDCFKVISSDIPKFPINNPSSVTVTRQVINVVPGQGKLMVEGDSFSKFEILAR